MITKIVRSNFEQFHIYLENVEMICRGRLTIKVSILPVPLLSWQTSYVHVKALRKFKARDDVLFTVDRRATKEAWNRKNPRVNEIRLSLTDNFSWNVSVSGNDCFHTRALSYYESIIWNINILIPQLFSYIFLTNSTSRLRRIWIIWII